MADSPTLRLARSLGLVPETGPVCEVCDSEDGILENWPQGVTAHRDCAPGHWVRDRDEADRFHSAVVAWSARRRGDPRIL